MLRKFLVLLLFATLALPVTTNKAEAQLSLLAGVVFGYALGSSGEESGPVGGNVIYRAPLSGEQILDPLGVRIVAKRFNFGYSNYGSSTRARSASLRALFESTVLNHEEFTLLEVMRVMDSQAHGVAVMWFAYIEKGKILPPTE